MSLSQNSQFLVDALEALPLLDGRFEKIKLANFNSFNNVKRGCFSLVFSAYDCVEDVPVALKFYDIDPRWINNDYRRAAFRREHEILQVLLNKERCLQLASALSTYNLDIPTIPGINATFPCEYFAVEWIDSDVDDYFYRQENFEPLDKLHLFNELTLAVEALHRHEVFHRDLKPDNLRQYQDALKRVVVAIDLGTAARFSSGYLQQYYQLPVGAYEYSSPEAICGLAGHRKLAPYTDCYALGCLLFELFNRDIFYRALLAKNPRCQAIQAVMGTYLKGITNDAEKLTAWKRALAKFSAGVEPVHIDGLGSTVPPGIASLLNEILRSLTHVDFSNRPIDLEWVRVRTWAAIKTLQNEKLYQRRLTLSREMRRRRIEKQRRKADALRRFITARTQLC
jgi:serine/threonine protein kinase